MNKKRGDRGRRWHIGQSQNQRFGSRPFIQRRKGQGASLQVMIAVLVVGGLALFLFLTQTTTTQETAERTASGLVSFNSRLLLTNMYENSYLTASKDKFGLVQAVAYGCSYGNPDKGFKYTASNKSEKLNFETERYLESYMEDTGGSFRIEVDCKNGETIEVGPEPPETGDVFSFRMEIPIPHGNRTELEMRRW
ncbi:MAG: hypothetical protein SVV03_04465 [Candidatus Nanohaloarchaea archaeon]|nr:hypothetical protein [Candidatus Nanohaloarchaea archaeon]